GQDLFVRVGEAGQVVGVIADQLRHALDEPARRLDAALEDVRELVVDEPIHADGRDAEDDALAAGLGLLALDFDLVDLALALGELLQVEAHPSLAAVAAAPAGLLAFQ